MRKVAGWALMLGLISGVAHAGVGRHAKWSSVEGLASGAEVEVLSGASAGPDVCMLESVDATALTCVREDRGEQGGARLVIPKDSVRDVWVLEQGPNRHPWLRIGIGFAIGAVLCGPIGPGPLFICGGLGALMAAGSLLSDHPSGWFGYPGPWGPPPPPPSMRWHRRLVYRMSP